MTPLHPFESLERCISTSYMCLQGQVQVHQGNHDAKRQRTSHNANTGYNQVQHTSALLSSGCSVAD